MEFWMLVVKRSSSMLFILQWCQYKYKYKYKNFISIEEQMSEHTLKNMADSSEPWLNDKKV